MTESCWLPSKIMFEDYNNDWLSYEARLYQIFKEDFIDSKPTFQEKKVQIRKHPIEFDKEEAFFHITCKCQDDTKERTPDLRRCERIRWVRSFIENYGCDSSNCDNCSGIKVWFEPYSSKQRVHFLFEEEKYIVILEQRENYYLLITAFYLEYDHSLKKQLKNYEKYKSI